jgi:minimal CRISPR polymerase domain/ParB-like nuclease domain
VDTPVSTTFVALDGDGIGKMVGIARLRDDVPEIRRVSQAIERGNAVFTSWAQANGGSVLEVGGDEALLEIPTASLSDLPRLREAYEAVVDATVSVGVGKTVSEASKALLVAKLRGRDRVIFFEPDMQKEIDEANAHPKSEESKLRDEYLGKADNQGSAADLSRKGAMVSHMDRPAPAAPVQGEHSEGAVAVAAAAPPAQSGEESPVLQGFRAHAAQADQADRAKAVQDSAGWQRLKLGVADALGKLRTQLPQLAQIKQAAPETYAAVTALANSVVEMARGIQQQEQTLQKAQGGPKVYRERTQGFSKPVEIPGREHPNRGSYDQGYLNAIASHYTKGDVKALKPLRVPVASLSGGNSAGAVNKDRLALYRKILAAGDEVPPVVVQRAGEGYRLLDGTHRAAAAQAQGVEDLPAVEVPVRKDEPGLSTVQTPNPVLKPLGEMALAEMSQEELDPSEAVPHGPDLAKEAMRTAPYKHLHLPVGSELAGRVKIQHANGKTTWRSVRAGQIQSTTPGEPPTVGQVGHPVSSRNPSST